MFFFFCGGFPVVCIDWLPCSASQLGSNCGPREPGPLGTLLSSACARQRGLGKALKGRYGEGFAVHRKSLAPADPSGHGQCWGGKGLDGSCQEFCCVPTLKYLIFKVGAKLCTGNRFCLGPGVKRKTATSISYKSPGEFFSLNKLFPASCLMLNKLNNNSCREYCAS